MLELGDLEPYTLYTFHVQVLIEGSPHEGNATSVQVQTSEAGK